MFLDKGWSPKNLRLQLGPGRKPFLRTQQKTEFSEEFTQKKKFLEIIL